MARYGLQIAYGANVVMTIRRPVFIGIDCVATAVNLKTIPQRKKSTPSEIVAFRSNHTPPAG